MTAPEDIDQVGARMHRRAARLAEATVYSSANPYLTRHQKLLVEAWFQTPLGMFDYLILGYLANRGLHYFQAFLFAYLAAGLACLILRFVRLPDWLLIAVAVPFTSWPHTVVCLGFAVWFLYHHAWITAAIALAPTVGILSVIAPSMHLYTLFCSPRGMHPKYGFAKSRFKITFPFECEDAEADTPSHDLHT